MSVDVSHQKISKACLDAWITSFERGGGHQNHKSLHPSYPNGSSWIPHFLNSISLRQSYKSNLEPCSKWVLEKVYKCSHSCVQTRWYILMECRRHTQDHLTITYEYFWYPDLPHYFIQRYSYYKRVVGLRLNIKSLQIKKKSGNSEPANCILK